MESLALPSVVVKITSMLQSWLILSHFQLIICIGHQVDQVTINLHPNRVSSESELPHYSHCTGSWKMGSPRPHYPTKCICALWFRSRCNYYFYPYGDICFCPTHWGFVIASVSIDSHSQGASTLNAVCVIKNLVEYQVNSTTSWKIGASASLINVQSSSSNQPPLDSHLYNSSLTILFDSEGP